MKIDLEKGINIRIAGELGKFNSIPIDTLVKISQKLQELIISIAKNDIQDSEAIDLNNFKIELSGFRAGSAVPQFSFTQRVKQTLNDVGIQRKSVNEKFERLIGVANKGNYQELKAIYPDVSRRNVIVNSMYGFINSFGTAPVSFVEVNEKEELSEVFKLRKFKTETKNSLLTEVTDLTETKEENFAVGKIKLTTSGKKIKRKIEELYTKSNTTLSYAPDVITHQGTSYILNFPLRCSLDKEDNYYIIQSELLDIVGTGESEDEAEESFAEEFSFIFKRYNELDDSKLSKRILQIKSVLNYIVKEVEE